MLTAPVTVPPDQGGSATRAAADPLILQRLVSCDSPTTPLAGENEQHLLLRRALGRTVRRLRRDEEISQADFAARAGLAANHLGEIERSERGLMLQTIMALASALDMDVSELLARAEALARTQTVGRPKA